jgi:ubiquinone/menaquinone biosynthesis C-methylase UbiE
VVRELPEIDPSHIHHAEWMIRKPSLERLAAFLRGPLLLLDVGCGNGWMSNHLTRHGSVIGLDMNLPELEQGARVFTGNPHLAFVYGNLFEEIFPSETFAVIILAGSIQYFPDPIALLDRLTRFLKEKGEVHIIDSPFYSERTVSDARRHTRDHFRQLGVPEMRYHHHLFADLRAFNPELLHDPETLIHRIKRRFTSLSPFPWIRLERGARR